MAKKESKQKKINVRVDFTPMVDMLMLLITFFMLCTTLSKPQTMELTMPSNDENTQEEQKNEAKASETVTLYVAANTTIPHGSRRQHGVTRVSVTFSENTPQKTVRNRLSVLNWQ